MVEAYLKASEEKGAGMISIRCGGGKTVLALHIASILKKKTIVIVHKTFLMDQWAERIRQFLFFHATKKSNFWTHYEQKLYLK